MWSDPIKPEDIASSTPLLGPGAIRRICKGLIRAEQDRLMKERRIGPDVITTLRNPALTDEQADALTIDEATLGFDSLSILDLVLVFNRFFGLAATGIEDYLFVQRRLGDWIDLIGKHLEMTGEGQRFGFMTSGSTGAPKVAHHPIGTLRAECLAQIAGPFARMGQPSRILTAVPAYHIFGFLFSCALPELLQCPVIDCASLPPTAILRKTRPGDLIIGTPWNWQHMADLDQRFPAQVKGIVSAGPSDPSLWEKLGACGLWDLTEVYGATETAGIGWRTGADRPFHLLAHLKRSDGGISPSNHPFSTLPLQDRLIWHDDLHFDLAGRRDDIVQVSGVNVSPQHVRKIAIAVDGIADAVIRLDGDRLKAFVVTANPTTTDTTPLEQRLRTAFAAQLAAPARPQSIRFGTALPRNAMGKLCDWAVDGADFAHSAAINSK